MNFDNKIPIAVIITVILQAAGIIWWVSQQAHTVEILKEDVGGLSSKMAIEQNVNLRRDVAEHQRKLETILDELGEHKRMGQMMSKMMQKTALMAKDVERMSDDLDELWEAFEEHEDRHRVDERGR